MRLHLADTFLHLRPEHGANSRGVRKILGNVWKVFVSVGETGVAAQARGCEKGLRRQLDAKRTISADLLPAFTLHRLTQHFLPHKRTTGNKTVQHFTQREAQSHMCNYILTNCLFQFLFVCSIFLFQLCVVRKYRRRSGVLSSVQRTERRWEIRQEKVVPDRLTLHGLWRRPGIGFQLNALIKHSSVSR